MKILSEQSLVKELRKLSNSSIQRIWIASPYISNLKAVQQIIGNKWLNNPNISVHLLTDIEELSQLSYDTLEAFYKSGSIKSLRGLHAKMYIIDNQILITSANLTKTAFSKRYEIGVIIDGEEAKDAINQYENWWKNTAITVTLEHLHNLKTSCSGSGIDDKNTLPKLWDIPAEPSQQSNKSGTGKLKDYEYFISCYEDLANIYESIQRITPDIPLYFEVDGLLDYLFHHEGMPSNAYKRDKDSKLKEPRNLTRPNRIKEIKKYALKYKKWVEKGHDIRWRLRNSELIQNLLDSDSILNLSRNQIRDVANCLNCMNSFPINKSKFLNEVNNDQNIILESWSNLIHGSDDLKIRMVDCKKALMNFGDSSIQELIAFYNPEIYPIRNSNSNAGLRFFGYDVSI